MLVCLHFMDEVTHVCGKSLEVQEFEANSPPIVIEITTYNLIEKKKIILLCDVSLQLLA